MSAPALQGLSPWIIQRITAVYIAVYCLYFAYCLVALQAVTADSWYAWFASPFNNISMGLFIVAVIWHAWIGIRDVVLDYIHNVVARMLVFTLVVSVLLGSVLWAFRSLFLVVIK